jgi:ubiquinone/menaquinone biosynthesis C-methylase UbiE
VVGTMDNDKNRFEWTQIFKKSKSDLDYYQRHGEPTFVNKYYEYQLKRHFKKLLKDLDIEKGKYIFEIGSGTGRWAELLASKICTYFGIDFNFDALLRCQQKGLHNCYLVAMDGRKIGFKDNTFDYVFSITAIQHIPSKGWEEAIREMVRVAKPNGKLFIVEDNSIPWKEEFSKYSCQLLKRRGENYSFVRECFDYLVLKLYSGRDSSFKSGKIYLVINRFLTYISYLLEPFFELVVPSKFAKHIVLIFEKTTNI